MNHDQLFLILSIVCFLLGQFLHSVYITTNNFATNTQGYPIYLQSASTTCYGLSLIFFIVAGIMYNKNN